MIGGMLGVGLSAMGSAIKKATEIAKKTTTSSAPKQESSVSTVSNNGTSGNTLATRGYSDFHQKEINDLQTRQDYFTNAGNSVQANVYKGALDRKLGYVNNVKQFDNWDINDLDTYTHNKTAYLDLTTNPNSKQTKTVEQVMAENKALREKYGLTEDTMDSNTAGQLGADIVWGDFIGSGLGRTGGNEKDEKVAKTSEMLARRDNLFGYKPLGTVSGGVVDNIKSDNLANEERMVQTLSIGGSTKNIPYHIGIDKNGVKYATGNGIVSSNQPKNTDVFAQITPDGGGIGKTKDGKYIVKENDYEVEIKEVEVIDWFTQLYGF